MSAITETPHTLEFLLSEASGSRSREEGKVTAAVKAGMILEPDAGDWKPITDTDPTAKTLRIAIADADVGDQVAMIARDAEVAEVLLDYSVLDTHKAAAKARLAAFDIILR